MDVKVLNGELKTQKCDLLVLGLFEKTKTLSGIVASIDKSLGGVINKFVIQKDKFPAKFKETYLLQSYDKIPAGKVLIAGLGDKKKLTADTIRELAAKIVSKAQSIKARKICIDLGELNIEPLNSGCDFALGAILGEYSFDKYKSEKNKDKIKELILVEKNKTKFQKLQKGVAKGIKIAQAMNFARDLSNEPAQEVTPEKLADTAKKIKGGKDLQVKVYEKKEIEKMGMGAFLAVGKGSSQPPKFIHIKYTPAKPEKKIALVGKGITFDSGGLDIKPASSMLSMKDDMSGAACVLSIMNSLKEFSPNVEIHGIIAACENMPGCSAYKPGDVLVAKNKKTIEVDNTDAEGRLTLADALCFASELGVDEIIDIATLTGACMVALGTQAAGIMGTSQKLINDLIKSGAQSGERLWQLPLYDEYKDGLKSDVADIKNSGSRWAGASSAGIFLKEFVKKEIKWAHLDIAGVAFLESPQKELCKGATGAGLRTILNYILSV